MNYGNNYNNYQQYLQQNQRPLRRKSSAPLIVFIFILFIAILCFAGSVIYFRETAKYKTQLEIYDKLIKEYQNELENYQDNINNLQQLSSLNANSIPDPNAIIDSAGMGDINIAETAAKVSPSVVGIKITVPAQNTYSFWQTSPVEATGSGIILTEDGYIATNYHVVSYINTYSDAFITVLLNDETEYSAKYIGGDELNDVAVIKIDAKNLPFATIGSSDSVKVGDFVMAIGNPLGANLYGSVTLGIISGLDRKIEAENVAEKLIQTDAAINPGNSGGALLNLKGEVIGINTVKISTDNVEGIGFAIPMDYAKPLIDSIIQYGYVKGRPTIGVSGMDISSMTARYYDVPRGLYVEDIERGSGAEESGINRYDIITKINGENIYAMSDIVKIIRERKVGDTATVTIWREGNYYDLPVVLSEQR